MKKVSILGATGSIGQSTLSVLSEESFCLGAVTANKNVAALAQIARDRKAEMAVIADEALYQNLKEQLSGTGIKVAAGASGLMEAASYRVDVFVAAISGIAGLPATFAAATHQSHLAIANKEAIVCGGALLMKQAQKSCCKILPADSEHHALSRLLEKSGEVERVILTASGGALRDLPLEQMKDVLPEQATAHPVWSMGKKISIDSATMMNKVLELIEAHTLFDLPADKLAMVQHRESLVHALVEEAGGGLFAFLAAPDMRIALADILGAHHHDLPRLNFDTLTRLHFEPIDSARFPVVRLAQPVLLSGQAAAIILNAANEMLVGAFLHKRIAFNAIAKGVENVLEKMRVPQQPHTLEDITALDNLARKTTEAMIND